MVYYAKEVTVNLSVVRESPHDQGGEKGALRDASLQKLKESMFVPRFQAPPGKSERSALMSQLGIVFSDLSQFVEKVAVDYREEYDFKKYLQDRWNTLLERL